MNYRHFKPTDYIDSLIAQNDKVALKGILVGIINQDPRFETTRYEEAYDYICKRNQVILEEAYRTQSGEYTLDKSEWSREYFSLLLAWLTRNYAKERLEHIKEVGKAVFPSGAKSSVENIANFSKPATKQEKQKPGILLVVGIVVIILLLLVFLSSN